MKNTPIPCKAPEVRAILDGSKTQMRRVAKLTDSGRVKEPQGNRRWHIGDPEAILACPYGQVGDTLWVRETWCGEIDDHTSQLIYNEDGNTYKCLYRADGHHVVLDDGDGFTKTNKDGSEASPWKPSIHMPRWASRITLEITRVRVERLQDISESDARAEGVSGKHTADARYTAKEAYSFICSQINGGGSWDSNPFVWVIEFKRVKP